MKISYHTSPGGFNRWVGYGVAGFRIVTSLQELGHEVPFDDPSAPVQINFSQPYFYKRNPGQYCIGYTPWESDTLPVGWTDMMNEVDEVWATAPIVKKWFEDNGVVKPVKVVPHGIDPIWTPRRREVKGPVKFLHIGEPSARKNGQLVYDAFKEAFGDDPGVHLTIKATTHSEVRKYRNGENLGGVHNDPNVTVLLGIYPEEKLVELHYNHHVMVYPSAGEGFGFIPLQAICTGMPAIVTSWWPMYDKYIEPLSYTLGDGPSKVSMTTRKEGGDKGNYPGLMAIPDFDELVGLMIMQRQQWEAWPQEWSNHYYDQAIEAKREYDWKEIIKTAIDPVVARIENPTVVR